MINKKIKKSIEEKAKKFFKGASGCHDWMHIERVRTLALKIGREEGADLDVLELAALLHDIGRKEEMEGKGKICHAARGAELAKKILAKHSVGAERIASIAHCVAAHRFRNGLAPETIEAKILFDADKLDSIGAIGIGRAFLFAGNAGSNNLYTGNERRLAKSGGDYSYSREDSAALEYEIKLKKLKNRMLTKTGKKMAAARHNFMEDYFKRFWKEIRGEA